MENPFEIIIEKLERIENLIQAMNTTNNAIQHADLQPSIMTVKQVANYLSLSTSTIYGYTSSNNIPHAKRGKKVYFNKVAIDEWVFENKRLTNTEIEKMADDYLSKKPMR